METKQKNRKKANLPEQVKKLGNTTRVSKFLLFTSICVVAFFLNGCYSVSLQTLSNTPLEDAGSVYFFRHWAFEGGSTPAIVQVDGNNIIKLGNKQFTVIRLPEGQHEIGVQCPKAKKFIGIEGPEFRRDTKTVNICKNTKLYYEVKANPDIYAFAILYPAVDPKSMSTFLLKESSEAQFSQIQAKYKEIEVKYLP